MENYYIVPQEPGKFTTYPLQKCPNCHGKREYYMISTNDGNKTQKCQTCNWLWSANGITSSSYR